MYTANVWIVHRLEYIVCPHKKMRVIPYITVHCEGDKGSWTSIDLACSQWMMTDRY
jgi:hypothetical protein